MLNHLVSFGDFILRLASQTVSVPEFDGRGLSAVRKFDSNQLAANTPNEDRRSSATCLQVVLLVTPPPLQPPFVGNDPPPPLLLRPVEGHAVRGVRRPRRLGVRAGRQRAAALLRGRGDDAQAEPGGVGELRGARPSGAAHPAVAQAPRRLHVPRLGLALHRSPASLLAGVARHRGARRGHEVGGRWRAVTLRLLWPKFVSGS